MEQQKEFKANEVGAIVKLKSGSPIMTVTKIIDKEKIVCVWFVNGEPKESIFPIQALRELILSPSIAGKCGGETYSYSL